MTPIRMSERKLNREYTKFQERMIKAWRRGDVAGHLDVIDDQIAIGSPELKARAMQDRGRHNRRQRDLAAARQDYLAAMELLPADSPWRHQSMVGIAEICEAEGDSQQALTWYRRSLHEGYGTSMILTGILPVNEGKLDEADQPRAIELIQRFWEVLKLPGQPDLTDLPSCVKLIDQRFNQIGDEAMNPPAIENVVAERKLIYVDENGQEHEAAVEIGRPQVSTEHDGYWECRYRINGFDYERFGRGIGIDAIDAIRLAINSIGAELDHVRGIMEGEIRWEFGEDGSLGFPLPTDAGEES